MPSSAKPYTLNPKPYFFVDSLGKGWLKTGRLFLNIHSLVFTLRNFIHTNNTGGAMFPTKILKLSQTYQQIPNLFLNTYTPFNKFTTKTTNLI
ncbi:hypothetical protein A3F65_02620 [Candidatus Saccharibacteria bacterium RIFCSPHIGHO2_12_FULL_47_16b]|nr:MAG: hypothetical protein A3F65_02620 [Candidatus Saccharibacteria bacterium RIFCSPHIGHO2_12_FULL_47_16b]OGL38743.1 MAG: hypothetical protein A3J32_01640 [Candidatus Saccharibacteria bacterium RIFCSPLOWO2_02_FULL_46_7]